VEVTQDKDKYENDPNWEKVGETTRQVADILTKKQVTQYTATIYRNKLTGETV
jgi:hypothetical protein